MCDVVEVCKVGLVTSCQLRGWREFHGAQELLGHREIPSTPSVPSLFAALVRPHVGVIDVVHANGIITSNNRIMTQNVGPQNVMLLLCYHGRLSLSTIGDKCAKDNSGEGDFIRSNKFQYTKIHIIIAVK